MKRSSTATVAAMGVAGFVALFMTSPLPAQIACEAGKLLPPVGHYADNLGSSVAVWGNTAVAGAPVSVSPGAPGYAQVFRFNGSTWVHEQELVPVDDPTPPTRFGESVAVSGGTLMVGAPYTHDNFYRSGSVYVFRFDGSSWIFQQKLLASDGGGEFGEGVALSGDTALISASPGLGGSLYAFRFDGRRWVEEQKFSPSVQDPRHFWYMRLEVPSLSGDIAVVGARTHYCFSWYCPYKHCECLEHAEVLSAFVFRYDGSAWVQEQELVLDIPVPWYGASASISGDTIVMGASGLQDLNGPASGAAYVYAFDGSAWVQEQTLLASDGADYDLFGSSVAIDSDTIVVGASADHDNGRAAGSAYVFRHNGASWIQERKLRASDGGYGDRFGISVAVGGNVAVVGASLDDVYGADSGSAYAFDLAGLDCNGNDVCDARDISAGASEDLDGNGVPDECEAGVDLDRDGSVGIVDFLMLLAAWGPCGGPCPPTCPGDVDGDCAVGDADMDVLFENWGSCPGFVDCNGNGVLDECDIAGATSTDFDGDGVPDECQVPPPNDGCADAGPIGAGEFPFNTTAAFIDGLPFYCDGGADYIVRDVWFLYTPSCTGFATFSVCNDATFDTRLVVYYAGQCPPTNPLACSDNAPGCGQTSEVQTVVVQGVPYLVRIGRATSTGGPGVLTVSCAPLPGP